MKKLNVLVPSAGHPTRPSLLKCLKENGEREIRIIGVDMASDGIGPHIVDKFYNVPPRNDITYLDKIINICEKENIDVYYALGEEEAISAISRKDDFDALNTSIISPGYPEMVDIATSKCKWHDFLKAKGITHANYRNIYRFGEIENFIRELGYPDEDVFVKPARAKGGRGARVLTSKNLSKEYYTSRYGEPKISLKSYMEMLSPLTKKEFHPILAMECLPGTFYSVDVLSNNGKVHYAIPKIRIQGSASNTTVGQVDLNPEAIELVTQICDAFKFSYLQNYEMRYSKDGRLKVYDINPRGGASIALCKAAGANIAYYAIKMAIGEQIPQMKIKDKVKMIRFYDEFYL